MRSETQIFEKHGIIDKVGISVYRMNWYIAVCCKCGKKLCYTINGEVKEDYAVIDCER